MLGDRSAEVILVLYRVSGGPVAVDQQLTVFEDGRAVLDERHRSRGPISLTLPGDELERLRAELAAIEAGRWIRATRLRLMRIPRWFAKAFRFWDTEGGETDYELWRGRRVIASLTSRDLDGPPRATELLDEIRLRAIRSEPR